MRLDLTQASYESIYRTKAVEPSQAKTYSKKALREFVVPCLSDGEPPTASNSETGIGLLTLPKSWKQPLAEM
jgi:hypothetical protein